MVVFPFSRISAGIQALHGLENTATSTLPVFIKKSLTKGKILRSKMSERPLDGVWGRSMGYECATDIMAISTPAVTALTVLLNKQAEETEEVEQRILSNVKELVIPNIDAVRKSSADPQSQVHINMLETSLKEIIAPFSHKLSSRYLNLTPKEIQIANFIKEGRSSKEIAGILNVSKSAVDVHRYKLGKKSVLTAKKSTSEAI